MKHEHPFVGSGFFVVVQVVLEADLDDPEEDGLFPETTGSPYQPVDVNVPVQ